MNTINFRPLRADEVECRALRVDKDWCQLTLYKDARCDMRMLDELFTPLGWQRRHELINNSLFCTVSIYDGERGLWVEKQDVGVQSFVEKQKGEASDAFKRACTNWGIGRELYTQPPIFIGLEEKELSVREGSNGQKSYSLKRRVCFSAVKLEVDPQQAITELVIADQDGVERFAWQRPDRNQPASELMREVLQGLLEDTGMQPSELLRRIGKRFYRELHSMEDIRVPEFKWAHEQLEQLKKSQEPIGGAQIAAMDLELQRVGGNTKGILEYINQRFKAQLASIGDMSVQQWEYAMNALKKKPTICKANTQAGTRTN